MIDDITINLNNSSLMNLENIFQIVKVLAMVIIFKQINTGKCPFEQSASRSCKYRNISALIVRNPYISGLLYAKLSYLDTSSERTTYPLI